MELFVVKFKYDSGASIENKVCFVKAENAEEAKKIFNDNITKIFNLYEDTCTIKIVHKISCSKLLYAQGGNMWGITNNGSRYIL